MIKNYRDHAANERTYLAWIRTGVTVMALGFLIEKFEIFLAALARDGRATSIHGIVSSGPNDVAIALVGLGVIMIAAATIRYFGIKRELDGEATVRFRGHVLTLFIAAAMIAFGIYLLLYLSDLL